MINRNQIAEIVLTGGFSRDLNIRKLLNIVFPGKVLNTTIDPDLAVVYGAGILATIRSNNKNHPYTSILCLDCNPLPIGV